MALNPAFHILGILIAILSVVMLIPALVETGMGGDGTAFYIAAAITLFFGTGLMLSTRTRDMETLNLRQAFFLTTTAWVAIAAFGSLPFILARPDMGITNAVFESMSGITTTGSSVIPVIEDMSPGILIWRALLQWLGGVGIVIMALVILPMLGIGGMQLFRSESYDNPDQVLPRAAEIAVSLTTVYTGLTMAWAVMYYFAGMSAFDAAAHAMTTIATGGYSTRTASIAAFDSVLIEWLVVAGMIVGSLPFAHYMAMLHGGWKSLLRDSQVHWFFIITFAVVALMAWKLTFHTPYSALEAVRFATFNAVSMVTGTGFATDNFAVWEGSATVLMLFAMFVGGCSGSTTCGLKIFRLQVLAGNARIQLIKLLRPHAVAVAYFNGRPISEQVMDAVTGFFYLYLLCLVVVTILLGLTGLDMITALSGAATAISNVGPGLGDVIGPASNFNALPDTAKWIMCVAMLIGRLELFTVLVLFLPNYWRN